MKLKHILFSIGLLSLLGFYWPWDLPSLNPETPGTKAWLDKQSKIILAKTDNIDPTVLRLSLRAYVNARHKGIDNKQLLTVIDYSKPSTEKRLWVFDLKTGRTLFNTYVSHGRNSGDIHADSFSNAPGSLKSSLGVFETTDETYFGGEGYSLRLKGLEPGVNDNAYRRDIVMHGAPYVNAETVRRYGHIGRSWGCPAVDRSVAKPIIDTIKQNTLIFAYYPDHHWLNHSSFLA